MRAVGRFPLLACVTDLCVRLFFAGGRRCHLLEVTSINNDQTYSNITEKDIVVPVVCVFVTVIIS